jgi:hypothetical protein
MNNETTLRWETGEMLGCMNCGTRFELVLTNRGEEPCPSCGRGDCTTWADEVTE